MRAVMLRKAGTRAGRGSRREPECRRWVCGGKEKIHKGRERWGVMVMRKTETQGGSG